MSTPKIQYHFDGTESVAQREFAAAKFQSAMSLIATGSRENLLEAQRLLNEARALGHGKARIELIKLEGKNDLPELPPVEAKALMDGHRPAAPTKPPSERIIREAAPASLPPLECLQETSDDLDSLKMKANAGNVDAMAVLADWLFWGKNDTTVDTVTATEWMERAAEKGHPRAQWVIGKSNFFDKEDSPGAEAALALIAKSAAGGHWAAKNFLVYRQIDKDSNDKDAALMQAVYGNDRAAVLRLSRMYRTGDMMIQNDSKADMLAEAAARIPERRRKPDAKKPA